MLKHGAHLLVLHIDTAEQIELISNTETTLGLFLLVL